MIMFVELINAISAMKNRFKLLQEKYWSINLNFQKVYSFGVMIKIELKYIQTKSYSTGVMNMAKLLTWKNV